MLALSLCLPVLTWAAPQKASEAEQIRIVQQMSQEMRARIDRLPLLFPEATHVGMARDTRVRLNHEPIIVDGQRFDGIVFTAPATRASFAWAFPCPPTATRWYIFREKSDMSGFSDFIQRPRAGFGATQSWAPASVTKMTLQRLNAAALVPGERYVLWFNFKDSAPVELTVRAGFFDKQTLNNNGLPALLFPGGS